jgi:multiple sugar transport system permease protein
MSRTSPRGRPGRPGRQGRQGRTIVWALLLLGGVLMVMPFVYMLSTSLKSNAEVYELSLLPRAPTLANYRRLAEASGFPRWFFNSLVIAVLTTLSVLFFDSLVGYTLAKFRFRGRRLVFLAILSTLMIPTEMLVLPWYVMSKNLGWLDTYWGIMFPGMMTGFGTFLMKQFFEGVPDELLEAGRVDGLGEFQLWWRIAMPLVGPALSALAIFTFLGNWTAFLWPLISTTNRELYTLPVGLASFSGEFQREWEMVMAGASVATLPMLLVFVVLQKYIVRGVMLAGIKG